MCISLYNLSIISISMYINRNAILLNQKAGFFFIHRTIFATLIPHAPILFMAVHWEQNVSWYCTRRERSWIYHIWRLYKLLVHLLILPLGIEGVLCVKSLQTCPTLCNPMDPPCSSVRWIFQARILEWVAVLCSRGSSQARNQTHVSYISCIGRQVLYH